MTDVLEKIGIFYALWDCRSRICNNCVALEMCRKTDSTEKTIFFHRISEEVRSIIKERDKLLAKLKEEEAK